MWLLSITSPIQYIRNPWSPSCQNTPRAQLLPSPPWLLPSCKPPSSLAWTIAVALNTSLCFYLGCTTVCSKDRSQCRSCYSSAHNLAVAAVSLRVKVVIAAYSGRPDLEPFHLAFFCTLFPVTHSAPATLDSLLIFKHIMYASIWRPWHCMDCSSPQ